MDISLHGAMDGVSAAAVVRDRYALPVIYLTAHSDPNTLERAQLTEPFGYLLKPLGQTSIKAMVTMAIHKHQRERQIQNSRALLFKIIQGLPDGIVAADLSGEILFLNRAGEHITGWTSQDATGAELLNVAHIKNDDHRPLLPLLLQQALSGGFPVQLPDSSRLVTKDGNTVKVSGRLAVKIAGSGADGVFITLQQTSADGA